MTDTTQHCLLCEQRAREAERLREWNVRLRKALRNPPFEAYREAKREGCDAEGAWEAFREELWERSWAALREEDGDE